mmetsp:Transcript_32978/g.94716  ORF Transcript_32978/g.94716 Transcript_32978/m.94716 type:complete len:291 (+) Transcript_32978:86-958(+)
MARQYPAIRTSASRYNLAVALSRPTGDDVAWPATIPFAGNSPAPLPPGPVQPSAARHLEPAGDLFDTVDLDDGEDLVDISLVDISTSPTAATSTSAQKTGALRPPPGLESGDPASTSEFSTVMHALGDLPSQSTGDERTTVMLQRIAFEHTEETVSAALDRYGFSDTYDAVYVPRNRRKMINLGYAFVNFVHPTIAAEAIKRCSGRALGHFSDDRVCLAEYSSMQGERFFSHLEANAQGAKIRRPRSPSAPRSSSAAAPGSEAAACGPAAVRRARAVPLSDSAGSTAFRF